MGKRSYMPENAGGDPDNISNLKYGSIDSVITSPPYAENTHHGDDPAELEYLRPGRKARVAGTAGNSPDNLGNLKYGEIDAVVASPPYNAEPTASEKYLKIRSETGRDITQPSQRYAKYDAVVTSPPYEGINTTGKADSYNGRRGPHSQTQIPDYRESTDNIGNLKSASYLEAMLTVYQQCHKVLRDGGVMVLVTKDFIRDQKRIDLAGDTIKLCEEAGFSFLERHYRKLTSVSFWRTIYKQRYPDVPEINTEDILVFRKPGTK